MPQVLCEGQRTICGNWFSILWVSGIELRILRLRDKYHQPVSLPPPLIDFLQELPKNCRMFPELVSLCTKSNQCLVLLAGGRTQMSYRWPLILEDDQVDLALEYTLGQKVAGYEKLPRRYKDSYQKWGDGYTHTHTHFFVYYIYVPHVCHMKPEENVRSLRTGVTHGYKPLCRCWEPRLAPVEQQTILLISSSNFCFCFSFETISPCSCSWPGTSYVELSGLQLTSASASLSAGFKGLYRHTWQ